jgi:hypothetical protein
LKAKIFDFDFFFTRRQQNINPSAQRNKPSNKNSSRDSHPFKRTAGSQHSHSKASKAHTKEHEHRESSYKKGFFGFFLFLYDIQHCFICRPSDSTVSEDVGI